MPEPPERRARVGSLTAERFGRLRTIFEAALERPAAERHAFAIGACAGDVELLREVEQMLVADGQPDLLLDHPRPASSAREEGRLEPGTVLAGRYRILDLLGSGGMGEVYKAFDVILSQTVALKFLAPAHISEAALVRFRNEVRIARQVSHPHVCRVYDLGTVQGLHFLSMEYIDGEDLASLIRRLGRLPQDRAIELTRKICTGLAAAHDRGVLHRDLKPANIMIDGRGQVRITDFGLAGLAAEIPPSDRRSGTPAYMSPEQKAGQELTTRSDIYALGLVLREMLTGETGQTHPSEPVIDLDPAIERLILRCLEDKPHDRPSSALSVAMALPGGDPIAAALAAGETPSPEMIAASQEKEGFSPRAAMLCFSGVVVSLIVGLWIAETTSFLARAPLPIRPEALAARAQQLLESIGYSGPPRSRSYEFICCDQQAVEALYRYPPSRHPEILASHRPAIRSFQYSEHRAGLLPRDLVGVGTPVGPEPGMIVEQLDAIGRLLRLEVRPWVSPAATSPVDWTVLFSGAGLDPERFVATTPETIPPMSSDARFAWAGTYADNRMEKVRVEAASWGGRPVFFKIQLSPMQQSRALALNPVTGVAILSLLLLPLIVGSVMAWRNLKQGRTDRRGAAVMAGTAFTLAAGSWAIRAGHAASSLEGTLLIEMVSVPIFVAVSFWLTYLALEPYLRRYWPDALVSWTRLCHGRIRNPVVASHILVAIGTAQTFGLIVRPGFTIFSGGFSVVQLGGTEVTFLLQQTLLMLALGLAFALVAALLRQCIGSPLTAGLLLAVLFAVPAGFESYGTGPGWVFLSCCLFGAASLVWMWLLRRFGFLTNMIVWLIQGLALAWPLTLTGWFAARSMAIHLIPVAIAAWALWVIVSRRRQPSTESA